MRLTLMTLGRGDGLLGMLPSGLPGAPGPRGGEVSLVQVSCDGAPDAAAQHLFTTLGLHRVTPDLLQWRSEELARSHAASGAFWTLAQESHFDDFWADRIPQLRAVGWNIVVRPGFAHLNAPVQGWRLVLESGSGLAVGSEPLGELSQAPTPVSALGLARRQGSWLLSLGVEVQGRLVDLAPLLADLLRRDARWLDASHVAAIEDDALIVLRMPGGKRVDASAAPLKAIVLSVLDLLTRPRRKDGPLQLYPWDLFRLDALRQSLQFDQAARAGEHGDWQLRGDEGLRSLAQHLQRTPLPGIAVAPSGVGLALRSYQLEGVAWLQYLRAHRLGGILADDMGLGKTAQLLVHLLVEKQGGRADLPSLVVVPTSLLFNWQHEAQRVVPGLRVLTLHGKDRADDIVQLAQFDLVLTTYALVWRDLSTFAAQAFHLLVLDEAQMVKNAAGRAARALRRIKARHRLCLTGTPIENHLGELWAQFDFLMPGFLGDSRTFQRLWRKPIEVNGESARAAVLARRIRPFVLRRRKDAVAPELPPVTELVRYVRLQGRQRDLYESLRVAADTQVRRVLARSGFAAAQISILDVLLKLRQVCCDPWLVKHLDTAADRTTMERAKLELLREFLPSLVEQGRTVLVFSQFTEMLQLIEPELDALKLPWLALTGRTPPGRRAALVAGFQAGKAPVFLVSLKAGGVGLNLTAADTVIHVDPWWNPAVEQQATARAHRIGQHRPVMVYKLVAQGSIEDRMLELQARKQTLAQGVLGNDAAGAGKFSADDLRGLLAPMDD